MILRRPRVVVTGMGVLAANGIGVHAFWDSLVSARSGIGPITLFDASEFPVHAAGEVKGFDLSHYTDAPVKVNRIGRHTQFAMAAVKMALESAGIHLSDLARYQPLPVVIGVSTSAIEVIERGKDMMTARGPKKVSPYIVSGCQPHAIASAVGHMLNVTTSSITLSTACAAGLDAVAFAMDNIVQGRFDLAVVGGADAPINPLTVASFGATGMVPCDATGLEKLSRPFDRMRSGGIMAEGAGVFVVESLDHARARGAEPLLEIRGYASESDRRGDESGTGLANTMQRCLEHAGLRPDDIDYVCAHGPSDLVIDRVETRMIKQLLGRRAYGVPVSSIKGVTGNPLAAAGPMQLAACAMGARSGLIPPTANYEEPDPDCDLDYVPNKPYAMKFKHALLNVHGLGGGNSSLVVSAVDNA